MCSKPQQLAVNSSQAVLFRFNEVWLLEYFPVNSRREPGRSCLERRLSKKVGDAKWSYPTLRISRTIIFRLPSPDRLLGLTSISAPGIRSPTMFHSGSTSAAGKAL